MLRVRVLEYKSTQEGKKKMFEETIVNVSAAIAYRELGKNLIELLKLEADAERVGR